MSRFRFRRAIYKLLPGWLLEEDGERVAWSLQLMLDAYAQRMKLGAKARFPQFAPSDALPYMSRDRKIVRGIDEGDAAFAARLLPWLDHHKVRGNPFKKLEMLQAYLNTAVMVRQVDRRGNWFTIAADGTKSYSLDDGNWDWDSVAASPQFARSWVIIYPTAAGAPWAREAVWGDDTTRWGDGGTWGTDATPGEVAAIHAILRDWKCAGTRPEWVIIAFDDTKFDPTAPEPDGTWDNWGDSSTPKVESREATARYWDGRATE